MIDFNTDSFEWINPHDFWTGGKGQPECFVEGKEYPEGLLTLPVACY